MAITRIKIVTRRPGQPGVTRGFMAGSFVAHLGLGAIFLLFPGLRASPRIPSDAVIVELVASIPGAQAPTPAPIEAPAPAPEPEAPPEGVSLETRELERVPEKKPEEKPEEKPVEPKPDPPPPRPQDPAPEATSSGSTEAPMAGSAASGSSVAAFEIGDAAFAWYRASVTNALYSQWRQPMLSGLREPAEVRVAFEIMRDGNVRGLRIEDSSGVPSLDRSALRAISDATPLPPLPAAMREPYLPASFVFRLYPEGY